MKRLLILYLKIGVIHFAGLKAVGESVGNPVEYYYINIVSTMVLAKACQRHGVNRFVFSSSATVYEDNKVPFEESMDLLPTTNPYGETKAMSERILADIANANPDFSVSILRYFNPVGTHESGLIIADRMSRLCGVLGHCLRSTEPVNAEERATVY